MSEKPESWVERQAAIRQILAREVVRSQGDLVRKLKARGYRVTQPSVSRDLQQLHAAKVDGRYLAAPASLAPAPALAARLAGSIRAVKRAGPNLVVVQTPPGLASALALALDRAGWKEIVGTVAGDDTLFIATSGRAAQQRLEQYLQPLTRERLHA